MKVTLEELSRLVAESAFLEPFGFIVQSCAPAECTLQVPYAASLERPGGVVNGMVIMGAADVAMWLAIMTERGLDEQWVTSDMKTAFLRGARETDVTLRCAGAQARQAHGLRHGRVPRRQRRFAGAPCIERTRWCHPNHDGPAAET